MKAMSSAASDAPAFVVRAPSATYPVYVEWGVLDRVGERLLASGLRGPVFVVTDSTVAWLYAGRVEEALGRAGLESHTYTVPAGEASKSLATAGDLYAWLAEHRCERGSTILALGGGMVGDLAGFVAATFLRGVAVVQAPTSLAAMVDASIGGKTAVNLPAGKNLVGAFYQPRMVAADLDALRSLSARELASGWAEAIKHGLILDPSLFRLFEERVEDLLDLEPDITEDVVRRSMAIKARVVEEDERETYGPPHAAELRPHHRPRTGGRHGVHLAASRRGGFGGHGRRGRNRMAHGPRTSGGSGAVYGGTEGL